MFSRIAMRRRLFLAGTVGTLLRAGFAVQAQQPPAANAPVPGAAGPGPGPEAPLPPGSPLIGQPKTDGSQRLAPLASPPIPTAADKLPVDKLVTAKGFKIETYASGMANARSL